MPHRKTPIPEVKESHIVHHGFFDVRVDTLQLPHGPKRPYTVLNIKFHAAAVIAETKDGKLLVTQEYRHPTGQWLLSCPGGRIDTGESPIEAARRELLEETGYGGGEFSLLGSIYPYPSVTNQQIFFVHAKNVEYQQPPTLEDFELIHSELKTPEELFKSIATGSPVDGVFCSGLFLWRNCI
ncbi:MAG: NUDIX hydrolase [Verrucomicrobia bacterium]|nr:NUDIX hydrolase [Verrucomicrobiota bacterium]